jgi:hypothetical protein
MESNTIGSAANWNWTKLNLHASSLRTSIQTFSPRVWAQRYLNRIECSPWDGETIAWDGVWQYQSMNILGSMAIQQWSA